VSKDLVAIINSGNAKAQFALALPEHVSPDRFARILTTSVMNDDKLRSAKPESLLRAAVSIAALGLVTDPQLGEAYLIADRNGDVQQRIGYRGLIKLAHQADVPTVYAEAVHDNDHFELITGTTRRIDHKPLLKGDRGEAFLYYAVASDADGNVDFEYMTVAEVRRIRDTKSDGWKAFKSGKIKSTPWSTDEGEMSKKTVLRRLLKRVKMSSDKADALARALDAEDAAENGAGLKDITPAQQQAPARTSDELFAQLTSAANDTEHDPETGEIADDGDDHEHVEDERQAELV
jgi:recombination protein RecT